MRLFEKIKLIGGFLLPPHWAQTHFHLGCSDLFFQTKNNTLDTYFRRYHAVHTIQ